MRLDIFDAIRLMREELGEEVSILVINNQDEIKVRLMLYDNTISTFRNFEFGCGKEIENETEEAIRLNRQLRYGIASIKKLVN